MLHYGKAGVSIFFEIFRLKMANKKYVNLKRKSRSKLGELGSKNLVIDTKNLAITM